MHLDAHLVPVATLLTFGVRVAAGTGRLSDGESCRHEQCGS